jgi:hypothetical protein
VAFVATIEECASAEQLLALKTPEEREAALRPMPLPEDTIAILEALQLVR